MVEANRAAQERRETVRVVVDGVGIDAPQGATIIEAARLAGIEIPTLCYLRELNEIGACRVCVVEVEGIERLVAACNSPVFDGMEVRTDTQRVRLARRTNLQLILCAMTAAVRPVSETGRAVCRPWPTVWPSTTCRFPRASIPSRSTSVSRW